MKKAIGVLLLSHVGFSLVEDLAGTVAQRGVESYVLSSLPELRHRESRPRVLADLAERAHVTGAHVLTARDVDDYLDQLEAEGVSVLCCLTVWEGYRHLMAMANARLGVPDIGEKQVLALRDKLTLRNELADAGLSRSRAVALTPDTLIDSQRSGDRYFVKPVTGIASFGAFPLTSHTTWADLERIATEARSDTVYSSALVSAESRPSESGADDVPAVEFLVENYVRGAEFSFEVILVDTEPHVVAVHEKCEVTESVGTVLENACVSPPTSLSLDDLAAGILWVAGVLDFLALGWGCFHVEARHCEDGWDLIEVNPRVGGSLISASVAELTGGPGLLDLWLDSLLTARDSGCFLKVLHDLSYALDGTAPGGNATFFRVFFADPGTIRDIAVSEDLPLQPTLSQVILKPGDVVDSTSREVFLGQALWRMRRADQTSLLPELLTASARALDVSYETAH